MKHNFRVRRLFFIIKYYVVVVFYLFLFFLSKSCIDKRVCSTNAWKNPYYVPEHIFTFYFCIHFTPDYIEMLTNRFVRGQSVVTGQNKKNNNNWWIARRYINKIFFPNRWSGSVIFIETTTHYFFFLRDTPSYTHFTLLIDFLMKQVND